MKLTLFVSYVLVTITNCRRIQRQEIECYHWRNRGCRRGPKCHYKHLPDFLYFDLPLGQQPQYDRYGKEIYLNNHLSP